MSKEKGWTEARPGRGCAALQESGKQPTAAGLTEGGREAHDERAARVQRMAEQARAGRLSQDAARSGGAQDGQTFAQRSRGTCPLKPTKSPHHRSVDENGRAFEAFDPPPKPRRSHRWARRFVWRLIGFLLLLVLLAVAYLTLWPRLQEALTPNFSVRVPDSIEGLLPDEKMGYTAVDFSNAILGESREKKELVVMEQDVEVTSQISQELLNISLFSKQKIVHSFGTGVYTVDLKQLEASDIVYDEITGIITVTIPHAMLSYVNVDVEKTKFEDTKKALLAVGEIKMTAEQQHALDQSVDAALRERLTDPALQIKADELALIKARELFSAPIAALSDELIVKVVMA